MCKFESDQTDTETFEINAYKTVSVCFKYSLFQYSYLVKKV